MDSFFIAAAGFPALTAMKIGAVPAEELQSKSLVTEGDMSIIERWGYSERVVVNPL
jgi:hypothetical protein